VSEVERRHIAVNGIHLSALVQGAGANCQQTLVLLHGFTGSAASWIDLLPGLQEPGRRLIALDLPGHGHSDAPAQPARYACERCGADICAALLALGVGAQEAVLLGYSLGGRIALTIACSGFLRALILESASAGIRDPGEREQRRQSDDLLARRIENAGVEAFVTEWERLPLFASQCNLPEAAREALRAQRLRNRASGLANSLRGAGAGVQGPLHTHLPMLDLPVLLLAGALDEKYCRIAREMAASLPRARMEIVPGAGHAIHLEQPAGFAHLVNTFCHAVY
jgi:2-succinyl-6-hydroxy-2,4-cyclohexadiene-1-carboxylate synthase